MTTRQLIAAKCACGGTPSPAGECEECRKKRTAIATETRAPDSPAHVTQRPGQGSVPTQPGLGHDFSRVRVFPDTPHRAIGQGVAPADSVQADATVPPAVDVITGAGGTPSVKLTYSTVSRTQGACGDFDWIIKWGLLNATPSTNGFIVQKVTTDMFSQDCVDENKFDDQFDFWWEAFPVRNGQVGRSGGDEFRTTNTFGEKGSTVTSGEAKYMDGYTEPLKWGQHKGAGTMPATGSEPPGWSASGNKYRAIAIQWYDCCGGMKKGSPMQIDEFDT